MLADGDAAALADAEAAALVAAGSESDEQDARIMIDAEASAARAMPWRAGGFLMLTTSR
jgi:hypothetical protein